MYHYAVQPHTQYRGTMFQHGVLMLRSPHQTRRHANCVE